MHAVILGADDEHRHGTPRVGVFRRTRSVQTKHGDIHRSPRSNASPHVLDAIQSACLYRRTNIRDIGGMPGEARVVRNEYATDDASSRVDLRNTDEQTLSVGLICDDEWIDESKMRLAELNRTID